MQISTRKLFVALLYALIFSLLVLSAVSVSKRITIFNENKTVDRLHCVIIDAGHGGIDGGATSLSGVLESKINLDIALKLDDLLHLLGINTVMTRCDDCSLHTSGFTISAQKVSDLKRRVEIVNNIEKAVLISIHQNYFPDSRYYGAQVFYAPTEGSGVLAKNMQDYFVRMLNIGSNRQCKKASGIYLLEKINCPGVLVECGFLSNFEEEADLLTEHYQRKICCIIAISVLDFIDSDSFT